MKNNKSQSTIAGVIFVLVFTAVFLIALSHAPNNKITGYSIAEVTGMDIYVYPPESNFPNSYLDTDDGQLYDGNGVPRSTIPTANIMSYINTNQYGQASTQQQAHFNYLRNQQQQPSDTGDPQTYPYPPIDLPPTYDLTQPYENLDTGDWGHPGHTYIYQNGLVFKFDAGDNMVAYYYPDDQGNWYYLDDEGVINLMRDNFKNAANNAEGEYEAGQQAFENTEDMGENTENPTETRQSLPLDPPDIPEDYKKNKYTDLTGAIWVRDGDNWVLEDGQDFKIKNTGPGDNVVVTYTVIDNELVIQLPDVWLSTSVIKDETTGAVYQYTDSGWQVITFPPGAKPGDTLKSQGTDATYEYTENDGWVLKSFPQDLELGATFRGEASGMIYGCKKEATEDEEAEFKIKNYNYKFTDFWEGLKITLTRFQHLQGLSSVVGYSDEKIREHKESIDKIFAGMGVFGNRDYIPSVICASNIDPPSDGGAAYTTTPEGLMIQTAHIEGERTELNYADESGQHTEYLYKITGDVFNSETSQEDWIENMEFTAYIDGDRKVYLITDDDGNKGYKEVAPGETFSLSGESSIIHNSTGYFDKVCIEFKDPIEVVPQDLGSWIFSQDTLIDKVCNAIINSPTTPTSYTQEESGGETNINTDW